MTSSGGNSNPVSSFRKTVVKLKLRTETKLKLDIKFVVSSLFSF